MNETPALLITKLPHLDTIVIRQRGRSFFISTRDSIVIDIEGLSKIVEFLIDNEMMDYAILERIINERKQD